MITCNWNLSIALFYDRFKVENGQRFCALDVFLLNDRLKLYYCSITTHIMRGRCGRVRMVVNLRTTYAISAHHH